MNLKTLWTVDSIFQALLFGLVLGISIESGSARTSSLIIVGVNLLVGIVALAIVSRDQR